MPGSEPSSSLSYSICCIGFSIVAFTRVTFCSMDALLSLTDLTV